MSMASEQAPERPEWHREPRHHRHLESLDRAFTQIFSFAVDHTSPSVRHDLEDDGWLYAGTRQGVHIYSRERSPHDVIRRKEETFSETALPYFRGEGWLPGSWRASDVAATFSSIPARGAYETRLDSSKSHVVQVLDETCGDSLAHHYIRALFPVGARDQCVAGGYREEPDSCCAEERGRRGWYCLTSVEDALVPEVEGVQRSWIYLSGLSVLPMERPPLYDLPSESDAPAIPGVPSPRAKTRFERLGHTIETLSGPSYLATASPSPRVGWSEWDWTSGTVGRREGQATNNGVPRPPTNLVGSKRNAPAGIKRASLSRSGAGMSSSVLPTLASAPQSPYSSASPESDGEDQAGCHISYVIRIDPRGQLPITLVNQLSLTMPLVINNIRRYLAKNGFVPHLCRISSTPGVHVVGEEFDPAASTYKLQFRVPQEAAGGSTRIRFHGSTFGRGQFEVSVLRAADWSVEYDTEPLKDGELQPTKLPPDVKARRTSIRMTPVSPPDPKRSAAADEVKVSMTLGPYERDADPAALPGPRGGCTLVIANTVIGPTIQATISKSSEKRAAHALGGSLRRAMDTVGQIAADSSSIGRERATSCSDDGSTMGWRHRKSLEAARQTMEQVLRLREQEGLPPGLFDHQSGSRGPSRSASFSGRSRSGTGVSRMTAGSSGRRTPSRRRETTLATSSTIPADGDAFSAGSSTLESVGSGVETTSPTSYESGSPLAIKARSRTRS